MKKNNAYKVDHKRAQREAQVRKAKEAKVTKRIIDKANATYWADND